MICNDRMFASRDSSVISRFPYDWGADKGIYGLRKIKGFLDDVLKCKNSLIKRGKIIQELSLLRTDSLDCLKYSFIFIVTEWTLE